jgi:hypothetical protein
MVEIKISGVHSERASFVYDIFGRPPATSAQVARARGGLSCEIILVTSFVRHKRHR